MTVIPCAMNFFLIDVSSVQYFVQIVKIYCKACIIVTYYEKSMMWYFKGKCDMTDVVKPRNLVRFAPSKNDNARLISPSNRHCLLSYNKKGQRFFPLRLSKYCGYLQLSFSFAKVIYSNISRISPCSKLHHPFVDQLST